MKWHRDQFLITDDPKAVDLEAVVRLLHEGTYWTADFSADMIAEYIGHSLCFSLFDNGTLIGFARVITDQVAFGYLDDVVIDAGYRGQGLGVWLMECVMAQPTVKGLKKMMLATADAQSLYQKFGFTPLPHPEMVMERYNRVDFKQMDWAD